MAVSGALRGTFLKGQSLSRNAQHPVLKLKILLCDLERILIYLLHSSKGWGIHGKTRKNRVLKGYELEDEDSAGCY